MDQKGTDDIISEQEKTGDRYLKQRNCLYQLSPPAYCRRQIFRRFMEIVRKGIKIYTKQDLINEGDDNPGHYYYLVMGLKRLPILNFRISSGILRIQGVPIRTPVNSSLYCYTNGINENEL